MQRKCQQVMFPKHQTMPCDSRTGWTLISCVIWCSLNHSKGQFTHNPWAGGPRSICMYMYMYMKMPTFFLICGFFSQVHLSWLHFLYFRFPLKSSYFPSKLGKFFECTHCQNKQNCWLQLGLKAVWHTHIHMYVYIYIYYVPAQAQPTANDAFCPRGGSINWVHWPSMKSRPFRIMMQPLLKNSEEFTICMGLRHPRCPLCIANMPPIPSLFPSPSLPLQAMGGQKAWAACRFASTIVMPCARSSISALLDMR